MVIFKQKEKGVSFLFYAFLLFHGLYAFTPMIRSMRIAMYIDFALVFFWALIMLSNKNKYQLDKAIYKILLLSFIILSITVSYKLIGYSTAKIGTCMRYFGFFAAIPLGWYFVKNGSYKQKRLLLLLYSLIIVVSVVSNIIVTIPLVNMGMGSEEINDAAKTMNLPNFGDTSFTGYVFLCCIFYFVIICYEKKLINRIVALIIMGVCSYFTIICGMRGTTTILLMIGVLLVFVTKFLDRWKVSNDVIVFALILIALVVYINLESIVELLVQISPSERLANRFNDLLYTSRHGVGEDSFTGRGELFKISINSFFRSPITILFGIGEPLIEDDFVKAGVSGHSDILDIIAKLGIVGCFFLFRCFQLYYSYMKKLYKRTIYSNIHVYVFWMVLIYGFLKTIFWENFAIVTFIMFPLLFDILISESRSSNVKEAS